MSSLLRACWIEANPQELARNIQFQSKVPCLVNLETGSVLQPGADNTTVLTIQGQKVHVNRPFEAIKAGLEQDGQILKLA